jgi:putative membrane protein
MKHDFRSLSQFLPTWSRAVGVLPLMLVAGGFAMPASAQEVDRPEVAWGARLATDRLTASERAFLEQARESIRLQHRLGELGQSHARGSEVRAHAQKIVTDYRRIIERIEGLIRKKGAALLQPPKIPADVYQELAGKSGSEFERAFVEILSDLHERALSLFETAAADARDPDVRQFAATQLPILREHRNQITVLRKQFE